MKKLTISLLIGTMVLSLCACGNNTAADNNSDQNKSTTEVVQVPQESSEASSLTKSAETEAPAEDYDVTIYLPFVDMNYDDVQAYVDAMNKEEPDKQYQVYNDSYYSTVIKESERQEALKSLFAKSEIEKTLGEIVNNSDYNNAFTSFEYDDKLQNFVYYAKKDAFEEDKLNCSLALGYSAFLLSQMYQAYNLVKPEDIVTNLEVKDVDTGDVLFNSSDNK